MDEARIREALRAALAAIAPEVDLAALQRGQSLREQVDLDSMDVLNLAAVLQEQLHLSVPDRLLGEATSLDALVAALGALPEAGAAPGAGSALPCFDLRIGADMVTVRPMSADDAQREAVFVRELSDDTRYKRFMGTLHELPEAKLKYLTDIDQRRHVALVATVPRNGQDTFAGVARYVVDAAGSGCEFAVTVADPWQGTGLAGVLMHALMALARARGVKQMEGFVLATNRRMLKFMRQLGFRLAPLPDDARTVRARRAL